MVHHPVRLSLPLITRSELASGAVFFFFRLQPPPRSTLFPYTTLFRSVQGGRHGRTGAAARTARGRPRRSDRKSTRLNSSHQITSYAVFCLKKKTRNARIPAQPRRNRDIQRSLGSP